MLEQIEVSLNEMALVEKYELKISRWAYKISDKDDNYHLVRIP